MCRKLTAVQIFIVQLYATNQQLNPFLIFFFLDGYAHYGFYHHYYLITSLFGEAGTQTVVL